MKITQFPRGKDSKGGGWKREEQPGEACSNSAKMTVSDSRVEVLRSGHTGDPPEGRGRANGFGEQLWEMRRVTPSLQPEKLEEWSGPEL